MMGIREDASDLIEAIATITTTKVLRILHYRLGVSVNGENACWVGTTPIGVESCPPIIQKTFTEHIRKEDMDTGKGLVIEVKRVFENKYRIPIYR